MTETDEDSLLSVKGGLVATRFHSYEHFKQSVSITYGENLLNKYIPGMGKRWVHLIHCSNGSEVSAVLTTGVSELDFVAARDGNVWDKLWLLIRSPYTISQRKEMEKIFILARRREDLFGPGDPAIYDISEEVMANISVEDTAALQIDDFVSEKGYFNTINHITAQVLMTCLFSERLAGLVADAHERKTMPALITGEFTSQQIADLFNGPVDNYADIINNEWGQEVGKFLQAKYDINHLTYWTPELLAAFLNDVQSYYSWSFQIGFSPFRPEDDAVVLFSAKINNVMGVRSR